MSRTASDANTSELNGIIAGFRSVFYATGAFSFVINALLLVPAIYMLQIYDRVLSSRNLTTLAMLTLIMLALYVLEALLEFVRSRVLIRASAALDVRLGPRVFDAAFARHLRGTATGSAQAFSDLMAVRQFLTSQGLFAFFDTPWTPLCIIVISLLNPWLGVFALLSVIALLGTAYLTERLSNPVLVEANQSAVIANQYADSNLRNAETIAAMGMLGALRNRWFQRQTRFLAQQAHASDRAGAILAVARFLRLALQSGILGLGALLVIENQLTPGGMIAASILLGRALAPVELGISTWRGFVAARGAYARLGRLLEDHPAADAGLPLPRPAGNVSAENLLLGAPGSRDPILKGLSFRVPEGTLVAVIGPSAAGKSTLARALVGVWAPINGAVRLDGADVHRWNKEELGPWIGYLPQEVALLEGSIAENICRFREIDSDRVVHAAKRAGVHDLVLHLPQGYDTPVGPGGIVLSGGQRQRIALARAIYGDPALIVLDEPNANLDEAGDTALIAALNAMKQERRTVFVMTHRPNVLGVADAIMILVGGVMHAFGPRDAVMKTIASKAQAAEPAAPNPAAPA